MSTETPPITREQIRGRLAEIAPWPDPAPTDWRAAPCPYPSRAALEAAMEETAAIAREAGMAKPSVYELWQQAGGGTPDYDRDRFTALMREHGHLLRLGDEGHGEAPASLPCGWPGPRQDHQRGERP